MPIPADTEWDLGTDNLGKNTLKALNAARITPAKAMGMTYQELRQIPGLGVARCARIAATLVHMHAAEAAACNPDGAL